MNNFTNRPTGYLTEEEYNELLNQYEKGTLPLSTKEKKLINPKVAYEITDEMILNSIPTNINSYTELYGKINHFSKSSPVSNLLWDYLYFVNVDVFRPAAILFQNSLKTNGRRKAAYCSYPKGTTAYKKFWKTEFDRCTEGFEPYVDGKPCGIKISGEFYFYLNYAIINKLVENEDGSTKDKDDLPDFLAMDYYYFRELDARNSPHKYNLPSSYKLPMVLTKSRRKGFSYKEASSAICIMVFNSNAKVAIASAAGTDKTDAAEAAEKAVPILDHLSNYTPFGRSEVGDVKHNGGWKNEVPSITKTSVNITLGIYNTRTKEKRGRQSNLTTLALSKDDAASGSGLTRLYFEEAGKISNLNKAWGFAKESMKAGSLYRGLAIIFGCFVGDTFIFNNKGKAIKIKDLDINDGIVGYSSKSLIPQDINVIKEPFKKECITIKTQYGSITCSIDHPLLVTYNDNTQFPYYSDNTINDSTAYIRRYRTLSCWYERADKITANHSILIPKISEFNVFGKETIDRNIAHKDNYKLLEIFKYIEKNKTLPDIVWELDKKSTWTFISALFDLYGDGKIYKQDINHKGTLPLYRLFIAKLISKYPYNVDDTVKTELSKSIKMLLYKVGVLAYTKGDDQLINHICGNKFKEYYNSMTNDDLYIVSPNEVLELFIKNTHFQDTELRNISKNYASSLLSILLCRNVNTIENLRLSEDYQLPNILSFDNKRTVKPNDMFSNHIRNVYAYKVLGKPKLIKEPQTVYNLNCSPNHNYLANGYIAGNTGGEMISESGNAGRSKAFATLFNNPEANDLAAFNNIYDYQKTGTKCGYFVADMWSNFGSKIKINGDEYIGLDKKGNAFFWVAELFLNIERKHKHPSNGGNQRDYNLFLTQRCKTPSEAFFTTKGSIFNTADLLGVQSTIESTTYGFSKYFKVGELEESKDGIISFIPDLEDKIQPIVSMNYDNTNREGGLLIYEQPKKINNEIPNDAYIISCDPIGQDNEGGASLISIIVMKTPVYSAYEGFGYEGIVATYIGRKQYNPMTYARELLLKLSKYYNAKITYENDRDGGILQFFTTKNELNRLLPSPELVMSKHLPNSNTRMRRFGHSMATIHHKILGETLLNEWLDYRHPTKKGLNYKDEYIEKIGPRNMDLLKDQMMLEQLIAYNRKGNFDACFIKDTKVLTINGYKNIQDINVNELVYTKDDEYEPVVKLHKNIYNNLLYTFKIVGQYNDITCTENHPIYVNFNSKKKHKYRSKLNNAQFIKANEINDKMFFFLPKRKSLKNNKFSDDELYLLGWYIGDGSISGRKNNLLEITLGLHEEAAAEKLKNILCKLDPSRESVINTYTDKLNRTYKTHNKTLRAEPRYYKLKHSNAIRLMFRSDKICKFLLEHGGIAFNKQISNEIFNSKNVIPLLLGLFESDGCLCKDFNYDGSNRNSLKFTNTSEILIKQMRQLLLDNNIWNIVNKIKQRNKKYLTQYEIRIHNVNDINIVINDSPIYTKCKINNNTRKFKTYHIEKEDGFWTPIKSINTKSVFNNPEYVYNLTVLGNPSYLAENVLVHNCLTLMGAVIQLKELYDVNLLENTTKTDELKDSVSKWVNKKLNIDNFRRSEYTYI